MKHKEIATRPIVIASMTVTAFESFGIGFVCVKTWSDNLCEHCYKHIIRFDLHSLSHSMLTQNDRATL